MRRSRLLIAATVVLIAGCTATGSSFAADTEPAAESTDTVDYDEPTAGARFQRPGYRRPGEPELRRPVFRRAGAPRPVPSQREVFPPPLPAVDYEYVSVPDRWRIVESLGIHESIWDPYNQSTLKGDRPIFDTQDWFFNLAVVSDTVIEPRRLPTPVGAQANRRSGSLDIFGDDEQLAIVENLIVSMALIQGDTVFRPPDWEFRFTGIGNFNYTRVETFGVINADPTEGRDRYDDHFAIQDLFVDRHLWNRSDRYDFDSLRVGIQPFISDFRGFLFQDNPLGARLFGTFQNNRMQYNLAWFRRIEKDTNSGLNQVIDLRDDDVFVANLYYQDFPVLGYNVQGTVVYNRNREGDDLFFDENGFQQRPTPPRNRFGDDYDVVYLGFNTDGHFDRLNLTTSLYWALGQEDLNPIANDKQDINALFAAVEASIDFDWFRLKAFGLYSSGDDDVFDGDANGFDTIFDNPQFAGADTSFWQRQAIPFIGGGGVVLSGRNSFVPSLRTSKEQGQSNFVNPGLRLVGVGADFDVLPELRVLANATYLAFDETASLRELRNQGPIDREIGFDVSAGLVYRPLFIENVVLRLSGAVLFPGDGLKELFNDDSQHFPFYSVLANLILTY